MKVGVITAAGIGTKGRRLDNFTRAKFVNRFLYITTTLRVLR